MAAIKDPELKQESLSASIKTVTKSWESIKKKSDLIREEIAQNYFEANPTRKELFSTQKFEEELTEEVIQKRLYKHSCAIINCMETLVEFFNGNEEIKPILFVLGKSHKDFNVNEKMFLELKDSICRVIKSHLESETAKAWDTMLQYMFINYVFEGMHMINPF